MYDIYYHTLGVEPGCSDTEIRKRYLELLRQFPPEKFPEKFNRLHDAYEMLKNPIAMMDEMLFSLRTDDSIDQIIKSLVEELREERLPTDIILNMGK
ncbi:MAG: J domain-containing protein [Planctomycetaceae bacterium]|jgi:preprotein translocase subunit Sec63|nr:J domain-containing protein [Planctomycetaceae bacterium]